MIVRDKLSTIDWKLIQDTKKVGAFLCQGATCNFKGRQFTAWFTPKIPIQAGPNKFWGLPGMILSIESSDKLYFWEFVSISYDTKSKEITPTQKQPKDIEGDLSTYYKTRKKKAQDLKDKANAEGGSMEIEFMELD
jgi:GLPGLI family protein